MCIRTDGGEFVLAKMDQTFNLITWTFNVDVSSEFGCIISACTRFLKNSFQNSHVEFNRRQSNGVAHELAQEGPLNASSHIIDDAPSCICHILANEMQ